MLTHSQSVCGCFCVTTAELSEDLPKMFTTWSLQDIVCQPMFYMLQNNREDRATGPHRQRGPEKALWLSHNQKYVGASKSFPCSPHPPPNGHKMANRISRPEQDLELGWGGYIWHGRLSNNRTQDAKDGRWVPVWIDANGQRPGLQQTKDAHGLTTPSPSSPTPAPSFYTWTILSFQDLSCNGKKREREWNVELSHWNQKKNE